MQPTYDTTAGQAVDLAVRLLRDATQTAIKERTHKGDRDFATGVDYAIEDALRDFLTSSTPYGFLGEERGHTGSQDTYWCLDPIDGTLNFARGIPNYGISLALISDGQPIAGHIALPAHRERYCTRDGRALLNGEQVAVASTAHLKDAFVSPGDFATGVHSLEAYPEQVQILTCLIGSVSRVRMLGSAATDLAWLTAGRLDAHVVHSNKAWDMAAGVALARAAGAVVTHLDGSPYTLNDPDVLAAAPGVHGALVDLLASKV